MPRREKENRKISVPRGVTNVDLWGKARENVKSRVFHREGDNPVPSHIKQLSFEKYVLDHETVKDYGDVKSVLSKLESHNCVQK